MRRLLSILALLIFVSGCGLNQNTNNSNTENNTKSSSTSNQDGSQMTNLDSHLTAAKQAPDQGDDTKALDWLEKAIKIDPSVKAVAAEQDHFERFHNNARFKTLVGL